jgi:hypothetical protein
MRRTVLLNGIVSFAAAFVGGLLSVNVVIRPAEAQDARIRADQLVVQDSTGADRIQLQNGPGISARVQLLAPDGKSSMVNIATGAGRLTGGAFPNAAGLNIFSPDGTPIGRFGTGNPANDVAPDGLNLLLRDRQGRNRLALVVAPDGTPSIELLDDAGNVTWRAP